MDALERIRSLIAGFPGYGDAMPRRISDEQVRGFVGEALAQLPASVVDRLAQSERGYYDRVLLRCEFINQQVFRLFDADPTPQRIEATLLADVEVVEMAATLAALADSESDSILARLHDALDKRDAAMQIE